MTDMRAGGGDDEDHVGENDDEDNGDDDDNPNDKNIETSADEILTPDRFGKNWWTDAESIVRTTILAGCGVVPVEAHQIRKGNREYNANTKGYS